MARYRKSSSIELGNLFIDHMMAMTEERLEGKAEIAVELAYRDRLIELREAEIARIRDAHKAPVVLVLPLAMVMGAVFWVTALWLLGALR